MDFYNTIVTFLKDGGFFIFPIACVLIIGLVIAIERWVYLNSEKRRNKKAFEEFQPLLRTVDIEKMMHFSRENKSPVIRIIGCGIDMMKVSKMRGDVENAMSEGMLESMPKLQQRTGYLAVLANVATLLGLLGTIIGLIAAFTAVANADPAQKSELLSRSISVAMNTTAFGLIAAIPLLILHSLLQNKTTSIVNSIEMAAVKFLNIMTVNKAIYAGAPRVESLIPVDLAKEDQSVGFKSSALAAGAAAAPQATFAAEDLPKNSTDKAVETPVKESSASASVVSEQAAELTTSGEQNAETEGQAESADSVSDVKAEPASFAAAEPSSESLEAQAQAAEEKMKAAQAAAEEAKAKLAKMQEEAEAAQKNAEDAANKFGGQASAI